MKVHIAAFGSGMGHASRMAAVAGRLAASGHSVAFTSSGEVTIWLRSRGFECNNVPLVDVEFTEAGSFSASKTMKFLPLIIGRLVTQVDRELANIGRFAPDVVISDSMVSSVIASRALGVRSLAVLNQLKLISSPRTPRLAAQLIAGGSITLMNTIWELCDEILIPDLPPPYTISERNLWNAGSASTRARYIGFLTPNARKAARADAPLPWRETRKPRIFWQVSGPPPTRGRFLAKALECAKELEDGFLFVIAAGNPGGSADPIKVPGGYLCQWCSEVGPLIDGSDAIVSRAGHVSISDYIMRGRPAILVPIKAQTEQIGNANKADRLGIAIALDEDRLSPPLVREALVQLTSGSYGRRVRELQASAERYDGVRAMLEVIGAAQPA